MKCRTFLPSRGFSLIEVLVAIALLIALLGTLFIFMRNLLETRRRATEFAAQERAVSTLISSLESELMTSLVRGESAMAGIDGTETSLRILSRGVAVRSVDGSSQSLFRDLQVTEFRFQEAARSLEGRREVLGSSGRGSYIPLGGEIARVQFRYYDGQRWVTTFNSMTQNALPVAIEVAVWFRPWPGESPVSDDLEADDGESDQPSERLTFDDTVDPFDEDAVIDTELAMLPPPSPDRVRVIVIPDGGSP